MDFINDFDYSIYQWMVNDLKLKGNDLLAYSCIYKYSYDVQWFTCSLEDMSKYINCTKRGARFNLKKLTDKGLIERRIVKYDNGIKVYQYRTIPKKI